MEKTIKYLENGEYHYATVRSVGDLAQLKTDSKETLVEAINELWNGGGNADPSKAPKPEGYDQLVQDVADAVKNQQEISQQWVKWQNEEAQLTEERKQAYLQAMKEMQEAIDKAKADAAALDDKTAKLDEQITKTFSDLDASIQNMHEQLQKEADRMNKDLQDTKGALSTMRTDLQSAQMDNGKIHDELTNINGKFEHKVWQTDLDPLKEQIERAETSVQQTKDELLGKASRQDLDTVSNTVSKLDTQLKETAKGVEISVKKDELGGEIAEALINKTNILLGTRRFTTNNWTQRDHVEICSDPWKGFLVAKQNSPIEGIQQAYDVKAGTTYTFSLFAKMDTLDDSNKPQIILAKNNLDTSLDTKIDVWRKEIEDITSDFKRYDLTFTPSEDCTIYPHVISNSNNPIFVCGYQLEIGKELTPWEPNQEDVGDYVEKSEAQFNVYNDRIQALTEKQRQQGDTQEKLKTEVTQTAEGTRQVSENLKKTNDDITKLRGEFEVKADHMKSEYESYTNKAVGQISDSTLNLIRNSSFQNKDSDFDQWQNVSAKANVRSDENGLRWVELTQSGLTTDNPQGLTSNYFNVKQGKVTIAVDIKSGDKATLDNESVLFLELYNEAKKRVDFRFVTLSELGLGVSLLGDHKVHRGLYRLGIDRNDAKYMTVKAHLMRNGDLYFTNFSARLSSIDDGAYEPNPDDINQQILKQNTKIEQNAKEVAIKANSVDVTRDIKSAVDGIKVGGTNLIKNSGTDIVIESKTTDAFPAWKYHVVYWNLTPGETYTFSSSALGTNGVNKASMRIFNEAVNKEVGNANFYFPADGKRHSKTFTIPDDGTSYSVYLYAGHMSKIEGKNFATTYHHPQLELGNKSTSWSPAPEDTSAEIKSAKDAAIQVASDQINIHVNELSTSFDDKLDKRVNEVKTASEKFISDGIEQTVTKITNVKNDVDKLGDKVNNTGTRNLLHNTSDKYRTLTGSGYLCQSTASDIYTSTANYHGGNWFTYAATITNNSSKNVVLETWLFDQNKSALDQNSTNPILAGTHSVVVYPGEKNKRVSTTFQISGTTWYIRTYVVFDDGGAPANSQVQVKDERLIEGKSAATWSPNPDDIDQKIDNVKTEVTASVKNLGDRVTTEVKSVETRVNNKVDNLQVGGRNLQIGTGDCSFDIGLNGNTMTIEKYDDYTKMIHTKKGGFYTLYSSKSFVPIVGKTYTISADVKGNGTLSGGVFKYEGGDNGSLGTTIVTNNWQRVSNTIHVNKISGQWIIYPANSTDFYVKHLKIEEGNKPTDWTPAPEDAEEAIKSLNTKWDVANGQIQGKVTATDVNNILNGKGYATQSWAQTQFQMKSDSITLQAVRDNITNGIQNQVNSIQGKLEGDLSNICRNPTFSHGVEGWKSSHLAVEGPWSEMPTPKNGTLFVRDAYYGELFPVSKGERYYTSVFAHNGDSSDFVLGLCFKLKDGTLSWISGSRVPGGQTGKYDGCIDVPDNAVSAQIWASIQKFDNFGWVRFTNVVVKKNDAISQINLSPDQIKIASNKIVIDGNTDIHGTLRVPTVKLQGKTGLVDLSGEGINITKTNGAGINLASNGIQLTANTNGQNEIEGVLTTAWSMNNKNQNGIGLVITPEQTLGRPYGGDILTIGEMVAPETIHAAMVFDATGINPDYRRGFNWFAPHTLNGDGGVLRFPGAQDDLMLYPGNMPGSRQSSYSQPTLRLVHGNSQGSAGVQFQWYDIVPFGRITSSMSYVSAVGTDDDGGITVSWYSYGAWYSGRKAPSIVYRGSDGNRGNGGIVFYPGGEVCFWQGDFHSNLRWSGMKNTD